MADPHPQQDEEVSAPLVNPERTQQAEEQNRLQQQEEDDNRDTHLEETLKLLEWFLYFLGFNQSSLPTFALSWVTFLLVGVALPVAALELFSCSDCDMYEINDFELGIVVSQACLAAVSLLSVSHNFRKYGIRNFLFMDREYCEMTQFRDEYISKISASTRLLVLWVLPCFILKITREVIRFYYVRHEARWQSTARLIAFTVSWTYVTSISLSASILFHLVCNLQLIHFDNYGEMLNGDSDLLIFIAKHMHLRNHLSIISHRFRVYLLLEFALVTVSQVVTLFQITGYSGIISLVNGGDFAVASIVQVVEITLCLHAATKISHRAQRISSHASTWHALLTCNSAYACQGRISSNAQSLEASNLLGSLSLNYSESDLESLESTILPTNTRDNLSSFQSRQAFVMYLQANPGGITIFGVTVDRGLINTIFFIQLTLITFVLGKTIVLSSR